LKSPGKSSVVIDVPTQCRSPASLLSGRYLPTPGRLNGRPGRPPPPPDAPGELSPRPAGRVARSGARPGRRAGPAGCAITCPGVHRAYTTHLRTCDERYCAAAGGVAVSRIAAGLSAVQLPGPRLRIAAGSYFPAGADGRQLELTFPGGSWRRPRQFLAPARRFPNDRSSSRNPVTELRARGQSS
jgi:hypothetical protein